MRASYRETILLRFGLGLTVPEIAAHFQISQAAAKKRVLRAAAQVRKRMAAIDGEEFCPRCASWRAARAFEHRRAGLAEEAEAEALRAHFAHCGSCRSFLAALRDELHDLGSSAAGALLAGHRLGGRIDVLRQLAAGPGPRWHSAQGAAARLRHLRAARLPPPSLRATAPPGR